MLYKESKETEQVKLTPEEIAAQEKKMIDFYEARLPLLRVQEEYERLIASISESRTAEFEARIRMAQLNQHLKKEEEPKKSS